MPGPMKNQRHERMAQELAKGTPQFEAYQIAGFRGGKQVASEVAARSDVRARVKEILGRAATRTEITVAAITDRLIKIADKAEADALGAAGLAVSRASLMDVAKLNGILPERHEITGKGGGPIEYRNLDEAEIDARLMALSERNAGPASLAP